MALANINSRQAILEAVAEYDQLGPAAFLRSYGFGKAREYFLVIEGQTYDSKAIVGAAHGYQFPDQGPLKARDFSGGYATVQKLLASLGFIVRVTKRE